MINWLRIILFALVLALASLVLMPIQIVCLWLDLKPRRLLPRYWHRMACYLLGIKVRVHGMPERRRPLLLCANHASWKDILVLSSVADVVFVAKSEVKAMAGLRHSRAVAGIDLRRARAKAVDRKAGQRDRPAARWRRDRRAFPGRHDLRRQPPARNQDVAVRRSRFCCAAFTDRHGPRSAGRHLLYGHSRNADGALQQADRRLARRYRLWRRICSASCAKGRSRWMSISARPSTTTTTPTARKSAA